MSHTDVLYTAEEIKLQSKMSRLDKANATYKEIVTVPAVQKFHYLDRWNEFSAVHFLLENENRGVRKFRTYKRGTIIFVNFGTSIGSELSGNHFAIVLNKTDNPFSGKLTVPQFLQNQIKVICQLKKN